MILLTLVSYSNSLELVLQTVDHYQMKIATASLFAFEYQYVKDSRETVDVSGTIREVHSLPN